MTTDPLAAQFHAAFQAFRVRLTTGDGFLDANGVLYPDTLLGSTEWQQTVADADRFARDAGLPPFAP